ncbi:Hypothetical protein LUCI_1383 [Lucifera butyrica]|uniref:Uncharacterized protein n=1 Tax=Lucifera butyrica TaxID=1351585 RepID=A0A498R5Q7_9FIRM|nr:hypothetical protein [Lucifera butyrica]VBB06167.1 Hypothetical protein LUCI_1383 [Lucifera butyrica]
MIIIYQGAQYYLPWLACCAHLENFCLSRMEMSLHSLTGTNPLMPVGTDRDGNLVCLLVSGRHRQMYQRNLSDIATMFAVEVKIIDVDCLYWQGLKGHAWGRWLSYIKYCYLPAFLRCSLNWPVYDVLRQQLALLRREPV